MAAPARPTLAHEGKLPVQQRPVSFAPFTQPKSLVALSQNRPRFQAAAGFAQIVQRMGTNIAFVSAEDRFFETPDRTQRIRVDPENDAYLEHHFSELTRVSRTTASLVQKIVFIIRTYKVVPYNKQKKIDALESQQQEVAISGGAISQQVRNLGTMFHAGAVTCWEKAALCHISLAEIGIGSVLEGGYNKTTGVGHAWLSLDIGCVIDPTKGKILPRSDYEAKYNITVLGKRIASPRVAVSAREQREAMIQAQAITDAISANSLDADVAREFEGLRARVQAIKEADEGAARFEEEQLKRVGPMVVTPEGNIRRRDVPVPAPVTRPDRNVNNWTPYERGGEFEL